MSGRQWQDPGGSFIDEGVSAQFQDPGGSFLNLDSIPTLKSAQIPGGTFVLITSDTYHRQIPGYQFIDERIFSKTGIRRIIII